MAADEDNDRGRTEAFEALHNPNLTVVAESIRADRSTAPARWIQSQMARFSDGNDHAERRDTVSRLVASLPVLPLLNHTRDETEARLVELADGWSTRRSVADDGTQAYATWLDSGSMTLDAMPYFARRRPVTSLAQFLLPAVDDVDPIVDDVAGLVRTLAPSASTDEVLRTEGDAAANRLLGHFGDDAEAIAAISILFQTHDATAALIGQALTIDEAGCSARDRVNWAIMHRAPVTQTVRHRSLEAGGALVVRLDSAGPYPLTFGSGSHACPGRQLASLLAEAVIGPMVDRRWRPIRESLVYEDRPNLSLPATLVGRLDSFPP